MVILIKNNNNNNKLIYSLPSTSACFLKKVNFKSYPRH